MIDSYEIIEVIELCDFFQIRNAEFVLMDTESDISLIQSFSDKFEYWKSIQPYHVNLIDELHANENAHSRVLVKLLNYCADGEFPILQSFIEHFKDNNVEYHFKHKICKPSVSAEKHRIDALVIDEDFAIIVENKIHNAKDQEKQLERYIEKIQKLKSLKFADEDIYVFYLSSTGKSPSQDSFSDTLKEKFKSRYIELSYRFDIISWLQLNILLNCKPQEEYLISALQQYIDHLKGLFHMRKIDQKMNEELLKALENQLDLKLSSIESIKTIGRTIERLDNTREYLDLLQKQYWFKYWKEQISTDFKEYSVIDSFEDLSDLPKVGIILEFENVKFSIVIEMGAKLYYGVGRHFATSVFDSNVATLLYDLMPKGFEEDKPWWYGWGYTEFKYAYKDFKELASKIISHSQFVEKS